MFSGVAIWNKSRINHYATLALLLLLNLFEGNGDVVLVNPVA